MPYDPTIPVEEKAVSIYLVVDSIYVKKSIYELQTEGCFSNYLLFQGKEYKLSEPPAPDLILWQNKGKNVYLRAFLSWALTLLICMASYVLFGFIQYKQNKLLSEYNFDIDCEVLFPSTSF